MRQSNLRARLLSPLGYAVAASLLLTGTWMSLQQQVATPRGLTRSIFAGVDSRQLHSSTPTRTIGPDFLEQVVDLPRPFRVRWSGYWFSPFEELVTLQARSDSGVSVYLDGELLLRHDAASRGSPAVATVTLSSGAHQLVVDYDHEHQGQELSVQWMPGASEPRPLPPGRLFTRRLDRRDFYETSAIGWLGWVVIAAWLVLPGLAVSPGIRRRATGAMHYLRTVPRVFETTGVTVPQAGHVFALTALAVAHPLFDVVSQEPAFFVARNTTLADLVALVGVVCIGLPTAVVGIEMGLARFSATTASYAHLTVVTVLLGAFVMPILKRAEVLGAVASIALALLIAGSGALAYRRFGFVRSFATMLSPAIVIVPIAFLMSPSVREAVVSADGLYSAARVASAPPIVLVVFDEFPVSALLDRTHRINRTRYPNFASLADTATWYRNASTVSSNTVWAVPAIVSGRYPIELNSVPTLRYYPINLFTMLSERYRMTAFGRFLQLCLANTCTYDLEVHDSVSALVADLGVVYSHIVSPEAVAARLPPILGDWRDFATRRMSRDENGERRGNARAAEFERFLETITPDPEGRLYFLHTLTPHMPFEYVPSGRRYDAPDYQGHQEGGRGLFFESDPWLPVVLQQRHLLQVGFVDRFVGRLVDRLKAHGIFDQSLVIITADHGTSFQDGMSRRGFAEGTRAEVSLVPLIVKFPNQVSGSVSDRNVETIDILPTIANVLSTTVPHGVDGRSLLDTTQPQRPHKTFVRRNATRVTVEEYESNLENRHVALEHNLEHFESGLYALGPHASLVGVPLSALEVGTATEPLLRLDDPSQFHKVDIESHTLPLSVRGKMGNDIEKRVSLAIAINGVVTATTMSYLEHDEWVFASMIPWEALVPGSNDVRVFVVVGESERPRLTLATPEPR